MVSELEVKFLEFREKCNKFELFEVELNKRIVEL